MGTGKTTLGAEIARISQLPFFDLDVEIENSVGMTIPEIFARNGERHFRDLESVLLKKLLAEWQEPIVLATGGGAVLREENRKCMLEYGLVVNTVANRDVILQRLSDSQYKRPLLKGDLAERIELLLHERVQAYDFAHMSIQTDQFDISTTANNILSAWHGDCPISAKA